MLRVRTFKYSAKKEIKAIKFSCEGSQTLTTTAKSKSGLNFEYSLDNGETWTKWSNSSNGAYPSISFGNGVNLYLRGNNPNGINTSNGNEFNFVFGSSSEVNCTGNIMHLISYTQDLTTIPCNYCFANLFKACAALRTAPDLLPLNLTQGCYYRIFYQCTALNYVKILALKGEGTSNTNRSLRQFLYSTAASGTIVLNKNRNWASNDTAEIPTGWTIEEIIP